MDVIVLDGPGAGVVLKSRLPDPVTSTGMEKAGIDDTDDKAEEEAVVDVGDGVFVHVPVIVLGITLIITVSTSTSLDWMITGPVSRLRPPPV